MGDEKSPLTDLLGDPWTEARDPRGRKRHKRQPYIAEKVALLRGSDLSIEEIAARVGVCDKTLKKYYFRELDDGPALAKALVLEAIFEKAKSGNVSAARLMLDQFAKGETAIPVARAPAQPRPEPLGKKAQAEVEASIAHEGTGWGSILQ